MPGCKFTVLYSIIQCCTVLYSAVQYYTVLYSIIQCCIVLYSAIQYYTMLYSIIQCCTVLYSALQYYTVLYSIIQCCTVLYSIVQYWSHNNFFFCIYRPEFRWQNSTIQLQKFSQPTLLLFSKHIKLL